MEVVDLIAGRGAGHRRVDDADELAFRCDGRNGAMTNRPCLVDIQSAAEQPGHGLSVAAVLLVPPARRARSNAITPTI